MSILNAAQQEAMRKYKEAEAAKKLALTTTQNSEQNRNLSMQGLLDAQGRQAPQAAGTRVGNVAQAGYTQLASGPQDQVRAQQMGEVNRLQGVANGTVMGAGQMAVQQEGNRAIAQQQAMARMGRGGNAAIAARGAATNTANIGLNVAGQAGAAQRADASAASQTMAGLMGQTREQDIGVAGQNATLRQQTNLQNMDAKNQQIFQQAGLDQSTSLANMQARLTQMGMNDQASLAYLSQLYGVDMAEMQARLQLEMSKNKEAGNSTLGGLMTVGGAIIGGIAGGAPGAAAGASAAGSLGKSV